MSFRDRTIVITGASGGIGGETALLFAGEGANIVVNYLFSPEKAKRTADRIRGTGRKALVYMADVSEPDDGGRPQ